MLRRNQCTLNELVNGAMGTVVGYDWPEGERTPGQQPCGLQILFDDKTVGRQTRGTAEHTPTTIRPATARFNGKEGGIQFERYQYPVVLAWAVTIHKVQGISLDKAVIDLGSTIFDHGHAYVALSRVRSLQGVMLVGLLRASFDLIDAGVHAEYARLAQCPI